MLLPAGQKSLAARDKRLALPLEANAATLNTCPAHVHPALCCPGDGRRGAAGISASPPTLHYSPRQKVQAKEALLAFGLLSFGRFCSEGPLSMKTQWGRVSKEIPRAFSGGSENVPLLHTLLKSETGLWGTKREA